ncbi:MAG: class I SAM-dependent DNA methyltransferase [Chloroflexota bacterium]
MQFEHPAAVLWRSIELAVVKGVLSGSSYGRILDLACGEGRIARLVFGPGEADTGVDLSFEALAIAKDEGSYRHVAVADATKLPLGASAFNLVFSNSSIEHIPDLNSVLAETRRVLRSEGLFVFSAPSFRLADYFFYTRLFRVLGLERAARWYSSTRNRLLNHYHCYGAEQWAELLQASGLELLAYRYCLSPRVIGLWDLVASLGVVLRVLRLPAPPQSSVWAGLKRRLIRPLLVPLVLEDVDEGADLVVMARRVG